MNSRERVVAAMNMQRPDRVPLMCQFSIGFMMTQLHPNPVEFWYDQKTFADGLITLCEDFNFDGILVSLHGHSEKWREKIIETEVISEDRMILKFEDRKETHTWVDLPVVDFTNPIQPKSIDEIDIERDIPATLDYIPVSHNLYFKLDPDNVYGIFDYLYSKVGDKYSIHGEITSPFDYFLDILGYENGLVALIMDPEKSKAIMERFTQGVIEIAEGMCDKPIDAIKISSPFAGMGFISQEFYRDFVLPYEKKIIEVIKNRGKYVYVHTCGSIGDRLELMEQSGVSGLECLDPHPVGNVDLEDAFNRIGDTLFIKGNIDSVNTLLINDEEGVDTDVLKIINTGMTKGKGFILSTACSVAPLVPKERILRLSELVEQYGKY